MDQTSPSSQGIAKRLPGEEIDVDGEEWAGSSRETFRKQGIGRERVKRIATAKVV